MQLIPGRVMIFGTFDVYHPGHQFFIETAMAKAGEKDDGKRDFIVIVARDSTVKKLKPALRNPEALRLQVLQDAFPQITIVLGDEEDPMKVIKTYKPSLVCLGYDQIGFSEKLKKEFPEITIERISSFHPERFKSSMM